MFYNKTEKFEVYEVPLYSGVVTKRVNFALQKVRNRITQDFVSFGRNFVELIQKHRKYILRFKIPEYSSIEEQEVEEFSQDFIDLFQEAYKESEDFMVWEMLEE